MFETLRKRRSIRKFEDRPVEKEKIDTLLKSPFRPLHPRPSGPGSSFWWRTGELQCTIDKVV